MKNNNNTNSKETCCATEEVTNGNINITKVSTTYARICIVLLALNFALTGYVMSGVMELQSEQTSSNDGVVSVKNAKVAPAGEIAPTLEARDNKATAPAVDVRTVDRLPQ